MAILDGFRTATWAPGRGQGRGTLPVTSHQVPLTGTPSVYTIRFGTLTGSNDPHDRTNLRTIDRIVPPPNRGDLALAHLADPVPEGTVIVHDLASAAPAPGSAAVLVGWGPRRVQSR